MNVFFIKTIDRYFGTVLCFFLGIFKKKQSLKETRKVLFIQLWGIGETICTLPTLKALKNKYRNSSVHVLCTERNKDVYESVDFIDKMLLVRLSILDLARFAATHYNEFDIVIDMEEYLNISSILAFFVGKYRIGYGGQARSVLYDKTASYKANQHVVLTYFDLVRQIGVVGKPTELEPLQDRTQNEVERLLRQNHLLRKDKIIGFGTGAAESSRCRKWPEERFAQLADELVKKYKSKIILIGSSYEIAEIDSIIDKMKNKDAATNLAGKTTAKQLFGIIARMLLFVGNDSGPMHIAACQGIPTVGLFGPNLPSRFGPYGKNNSAVYKGNICGYSPCINVHLGQTPDCLYPKDSEDYQKCMKNIFVDDVIKAIEGIFHAKR